MTSPGSKPEDGPEATGDASEEGVESTAADETTATEGVVVDEPAELAEEPVDEPVELAEEPVELAEEPVDETDDADDSSSAAVAAAGTTAAAGAASAGASKSGASKGATGKGGTAVKPPSAKVRPKGGKKGADAGTRSSKLTKADIEGRDPQAKVLSVRFVLAIVLVLAGIAYIYKTYTALGPVMYSEWTLIPEGEQTRRWVWELGLWNYAIGFGAIFLGLIIAAHRSTPLGRGNGVLVGMLGCFLIGLLWICTFYVFSNDISNLWVLGPLGQWNLVIGIGFMAVGFSYATKWE